MWSLGTKGATLTRSIRELPVCARSVVPRLTAASVLHWQQQRGGGHRLVSADAAPAADTQSNEQAPPPLFQEVSAKDFQEWRTHAVTLVGKVAWEGEIRNIYSSAKNTSYKIASVPIEVVQTDDASAAATRVLLDFWNEKADEAAHFFKRGDYVEVSGSLLQDKWLDKDTQQPRMKLKVSVTRCNKIVDVPWAKGAE